MKIDMVMMSSLNSDGGGRETWIRNFFSEIYLRDLSVKFNLITLTASSEFKENHFYDACVESHYEIGAKKNKIPIPLQFIKKIFGFFKKKNTKSDIVLGVGGLNEAMAILSASLLGGCPSKKIIWLRTIYSKEKGYRLNKFSQRLLVAFEIFFIKNFFQMVIANGDDTAEFYRKHGVKCHVINNAIPLTCWQSLPKTPSTKVRIAFIGRLSEVKGIGAYLNSIKYLWEYNKIVFDFIEFSVIGTGPFEPEVVNLERMGALKYLGGVANDEVPALVSHVDCCVALTYLSDFLGGGGVSNALIEQMASEKIIIAWDNKIFRNVLTDKSAFFVEQGNVKDLAKCYVDMLSDLDGAYTRAFEAKAISSKYGIESHVSEFFDLIVK